MSNYSNEATMLHRDYAGAKMGMWLFLVTEMLLFGGMFLLYSVYRANHPHEFHQGAIELNTFVGTVNTIILLTSSLSMVLSIASVHKGNKKLSMLLLVITILLGIAFLVNKYFEWSAKIHHGIYPASPAMLEKSHGEVLFFGLYYAMTGLHGLHVLIGVGILSVILFMLPSMPARKMRLNLDENPGIKARQLVMISKSGTSTWEQELDDSIRSVDITLKYHPGGERGVFSEFVKLENAGLYWHLVDIIWIFLFPLFYLIT